MKVRLRPEAAGFVPAAEPGVAAWSGVLCVGDDSGGLCTPAARSAVAAAPARHSFLFSAAAAAR